MKRILCLIFALILSASSFTLPTLAAEIPAEDDDTVYILAIGNSYSNNASYYVPPIAYGLDKRVSVVSLYDDGCTLERHVKWYKENAKEYEFYIDGVNCSAPDKNTMKEAFALYDFDYVTIQQGSVSATTFSAYEPYLTELYGIIKKHEPQAKIMIHQTWSHNELTATEGNQYTSAVFKNSLDMFNEIENAYIQAANKIGLDPEKDIIPVGEAIQLAKDQYGFADIYNDGASSNYDHCANGALYTDTISHLNLRGRYIAGCVWVEKVFGLDCRNTTCSEGGIFSEEETMVMRQIAHEVVTGEVQCVSGDWRAVPYEVVDEKTLKSEKGVKLVHYMGEVPADGTITIPTTWDGKKVFMVDETTFKYVDGVKKVILPGNISYEKYTFEKIELEVTQVKTDNETSSVQGIDKSDGTEFEIGTGLIIAIVAVILFIVVIIMGIIFIKKQK